MEMRSGAAIDRVYPRPMSEPIEDEPLAVLRRWLDDAAAAGEPAPTECVLATASRDGWPSARMVNVKQVTGTGMVFSTRAGTRKADDLADNPRCSFVFWWPSLNRQVRAACEVEQMPRREVAPLFDARPLEHRVATVVSPQGSEIASIEEIRAAAGTMLVDAREHGVQCPDSFIAFRAVPYAVEFWSQGDHRLHERVEYRRIDDTWQRRLLAP